MLLFVENCLDTMARFKESHFDMIFTSPPYDNLRDYHEYSFDFEPIAKELTRVLKPGGVIVWIVNDATVNGSETGTSFRQALYFMDDCGLRLHDTMIWKKTNITAQQSNRYLPIFEYMFVFSKGKPKTSNLLRDTPTKQTGTRKTPTTRKKDGVLKKGKMADFINCNDFRIRDNLWEMPGVMSNTERNGHPAQMPERLANDHIMTWTNPGELVYDPFMGSGTTAIACMNLGRFWVGSEISKDYAKICMERVDKNGPRIWHTRAEGEKEISGRGRRPGSEPLRQ